MRKRIKKQDSETSDFRLRTDKPAIVIMVILVILGTLLIMGEQAKITGRQTLEDLNDTNEIETNTTELELAQTATETNQTETEIEKNETEAKTNETEIEPNTTPLETTETEINETVQEEIETENPKKNKIKLPKAEKFSKTLTTDLDSLNEEKIKNVKKLRLGIEKKGKIDYIIDEEEHGIDLEGIDLDNVVEIGTNFISIDSDKEPELNRKARLTIYEVPYKHPIVYMDGNPCPSDVCYDYELYFGEFEFTVEHFTNYTSGPNTNLTIWDQNDTGMGYGNQNAVSGELIYFFANYSNITDGSAVTDADCNITFNDSSTALMSYNATKDLFEYNRTFSAGDYKWNVTCNQTDYETLNLTDYINVTEAQDTTNPQINFTPPTPPNETTQTETNVEINVSIVEENLEELTYNWNGTNYTMYNDSLILMYNFDSTNINDTIIMNVTVSGNGYLYQDLTSVSDYTIQSGDYVEYDVYWTSTNDYIAFDYTTSDSTTLRDSGATDQNGLSAHANNADLTNYALNKWYHRKIAIPAGHVGKSINYYDIVSESDTAGTHVAYLDNIMITDGAGTVRKTIYNDGSFTDAPSLVGSANTVLNNLDNTTDSPQRIYDTSNSGNNGTYRGIIINSTGKHNGAAHFDGINDYAIVPYDSSLDGMTELTISVWAYVHECEAADEFVKKDLSYILRMDGTCHVDVHTWATNDDRTLTSTGTFNTNEWVHIALVYTPSLEAQLIYINGAFDSYLSQTGPLDVNTGQHLSIGAHQDGTSEFLNGSIDEVRIWNRGLNAEEIYQLYASNLQKYNSTQWYLYVNQSKNSTDELDPGTYTYEAFAKDENGNSNSTELRSLRIGGILPNATNFDGATTNFDLEPDLYNVDGLILENTSHCIIKWNNDNINVSGADFDSYVKCANSWVSVNSTELHQTVNSSANITLYYLSYEKTPVIYEDGVLCPDCVALEYDSDKNFTFNVSHFTNYTAGPNANLTIWDQNDTGMDYGNQEANAGELIYFFANYSNVTSGATVTSADCNITFNDTSSAMMSYNVTKDLFEYNRTFTAGDYEWNVTCNHTDFETLNVTDYINVSDRYTGCVNLTDNNTWQNKVVNVSGTLYINESVSLCTDTYEYTGSSDFIRINTSDIELNCNGSKLNSTGLGITGINITGQENVNVTNCNISKFSTLLLMDNVNYSNLRDNYLTNSSISSINILYGHNNTLRNNNISGNDQGTGIKLNQTENNTIESNILEGYDENLEVHSSESNTIQHNNITRIRIIESTSNKVLDNYIDRSLEIEGHSNNTEIKRNNITTSNTLNAISVYNSSHIQIENNTLIDADKGIYITDSINETLNNNNITAFDDYGIHIDNVNETEIVNNNINNQAGTGAGIQVSGSHNNTFWNNRIVQLHSSSEGINIPTESRYNNISNNYIQDTNNAIIGGARTTFYNNTISRCGTAFYLQSEYSFDNIASHNNITNCSGTGAGFSMGQDSYNMTITHNSLNNCTIAIIEESNNNTINNNTVTTAAFGIKITGGTNNTASYNNITNVLGGIYINSTNNTFTLNRVNGAGTGLHIDSNASHTTINNLTLYNNGQDSPYLGFFGLIATDIRVRTGSDTVNFTATGIEILNPSGTYENYTTISITDVAEANTEYTINWTTEPGSLPSERGNFTEKFIELANRTAGVSIDEITWEWNESELTSEFNETFFELWKYNGTWTMLNDTPDVDANSLMLTDHSPGSTYGILQGPETLGTVGLEVLYPLTDLDVYKNETFNVTVNVSCQTTNCGEINVSLDPFQTYTVTLDYNDINADGHIHYSGGPYTRTDDPENIYTAVSGFVYRAFIEWNLSDLPANAQIQEINFSYYVNETYSSNNNINVTGLETNALSDYSTEQELYDSIGASNSVYYPSNTTPIGSFTDTLDSEAHSQIETNLQAGNKYWVMGAYVDGGGSTFWGAANHPDPAQRPNLTIRYTLETKGLVNTTEGATPFWTNISNPYTVNLDSGENETIVFWVNATGYANTKHEFFVYANITSDMSVSNETDHWNVTIRAPISSQLTDPEDRYNTTETSVTVNCSASGINLTNITLYTNITGSWEPNETNIVTGYSNSTEFIIEGLEVLKTYKWNCEANDTAGNSVFASDNRTFNIINNSLVTECRILNESGEYELANDIVGAPHDASEFFTGSSACIKIVASNVDLNCKGYNITNDGTSNSFGVILNGSSEVDYTNVTIRDCPGISEYVTSIGILNTSQITIRNITSNSSSGGNGIYSLYSEQILLENSTVDASYGVRMTYTNNSNITDNILMNTWAGSGGALNISYSNNIIIGNNTIPHSDTQGIHMSYVNYSNITNNRIFNTTETSIWIENSQNNILSYNFVNDSGERAIYLEESINNTLENNNLTWCSNNCLELIDSNLTNITGNKIEYVRGSNRNGIYATNSGNTTIANNEIAHTTDQGIDFANSYNITIANNEVHNCTTYGIEISSSTYVNITANTAYNVTNDCIRVHDSNTITLEHNIAYDAGRDGISTNDNINSTVYNNTAYQNDRYGIFIGGRNSYNSTVQENTAWGNANPPSGVGIAVTAPDSLVYRNNATANILGIVVANYANRTRVDSNIIYNNNYDFAAYMQFSGYFHYNMTNTSLRNDQGTLENATTLSMNDSTVVQGNAYSASWIASPATLPANKASFREKHVEIEDIAGFSAVPADISLVIFHWNDSEVTASYNETGFELWVYNSTNDWELLNNTPDTNTNQLSFTDLAPASTYSILQADVWNPNVSLVSPVNNNFTTEVNVTVVCNATDYNLSNITLYTNLSGSWTAYNTEDVTGSTEVEQEFNITDPGVGTFKWSCEANDTSGNSAFASENRTVTVALPCFNITDDSTWRNRIMNVTNILNVYSNITLCRQTHTHPTVLFQIETNDITIDCNQSTLIGQEAGSAIYANSKQNIEIRNCNITNFSNGITLGNTNNSRYYNNTIKYGSLGIDIGDSNNVTIINNTITETTQKHISIGYTNEEICEHNITNNTGEGNRPILFYNYTTQQSDLEISQLILCNADNSSFDNITIRSSDSLNNSGIFVYQTQNTNFSNINASYNYRGIDITKSDDIIVENSTFYAAQINILEANRTIFRNNNITYKTVVIENSNYSNFTNNLLNNVSDGFDVTYSKYNILENNQIYNSSQFCITLSNEATNISVVNNTCVGGLDGIYIYSNANDNTIIRNSVSRLPLSSKYYGTAYLLDTVNNTYLADNIGFDNAKNGIRIDNTNNTVMINNTFYNNTLGDLYIVSDATRVVNMTNTTLLNPLGTWENYSTISMNDQFGTETYYINWTATPAATPANKPSFAEKHVEIVESAGTVSIDNINWHWNESEVTASYNETGFELWVYNATGWTVLNQTPDTTGNVLSLSALEPSSTYSILQSDVMEPNVSLVSPIEGYNSTSVNVTVLCNATDMNLTNISLYTNVTGAWSINQSRAVTGTESEQEFNITYLNDGAYKWTCWANDTANNTAFANENRTFRVDTTGPILSSLEETPTDPDTYNASQDYEFNITWIDAGIGLDSAWLNFSNTNYTATGTNGEYNVTFPTLAAGTYTYVWYANDSFGNINYTTSSYTINQYSTTCNLTFDQTSPQTYGTAINATCSCDNGEVSATLWRNTTGEVTSENGTMVMLGAGSYNYTCNVSGTTNYTSATNTTVFNISQLVTTTNLYLNGTQGDITTTYGVDTNATANTTSGTATLYRNGSNNGNPEITTLAAGYYNYTAINTGDENRTPSNETWFLTVNKAAAAINLTVNGTNEDQTIEYGTTLNITALLLSGETNVTLYLNGTQIENSTLRIENITQFNITRTYNFTAIHPTTENYTLSNETVLITVQDTQDPNVTLVSPITNYNTTIYNITLTCNATDYNITNITLYTNTTGSWLANQTSAINSSSGEQDFNLTELPDGVYKWSCEANDTAGNSAFATENRTFNVDSHAPQWTSLEETPTDPDTYNASQDYEFNLTWTDSFIGMDSVWLNFSDTNYTATGSGGEYNVTFPTLAAGTYTYVWYANDSFGNINYTTSSYTINQYSTTCNLTFDQTSPQTYGTAINATCSCDNGEVSATLWRNTTGEVTSENGTMVMLGAGSYNYTCNVSGTTNYTSATNTTVFNISQLVTTTNLYLNGTQGDITTTYGVDTNATANTTSGTATLYRNGSNNGNPEITTLAAGYYNYTAINTGDENRTPSNETWFLTINKATPTINLTVNGTNGDQTIEYGESVNITALLINGETNVTLYQNGTQIGTNTTRIENITQFSTLIDYNITAIHPETQNYTLANSTIIVTVQDTQSPTTTLVSPVNTYNSTPVNITLTCNATDNYNLTNITLYTNATGSWLANQTKAINDTEGEKEFNLTDLPNGVYKWSCIANDTFGNSAFASTNRTFEVNDLGDFNPPQLVIDSPSSGATGVSINTSIKFNLTDDLGINYSHINISVEGTDYTSSANITPIGSQNASVELNASLFTFSYLQVINIEVNFSDNATRRSQESYSFTIQSDPTTPTTTPTSSGGGGGGSGICTTNWECTEWSGCINNKKTRTCRDTRNCQNPTQSPPTETDCTCETVWDCTDWSACESGTKKRSCELISLCPEKAYYEPREELACKEDEPSEDYYNDEEQFEGGTDALSRLTTEYIADGKYVNASEEEIEKTEQEDEKGSTEMKTSTMLVTQMKTYWPIIIILIVLVLLGYGGYRLYKYLKEKEKQQPSEEAQVQETTPKETPAKTEIKLKETKNTPEETKSTTKETKTQKVQDKPQEKVIEKPSPKKVEQSHYDVSDEPDYKNIKDIDTRLARIKQRLSKWKK